MEGKKHIFRFYIGSTGIVDFNPAVYFVYLFIKINLIHSLAIFMLDHQRMEIFIIYFFWENFDVIRFFTGLKNGQSHLKRQLTANFT